MIIKNKIGARIKEIRTKKKLTQEEVAWKANIDRTFMNHVENSKRDVSIETLEKIIYDGPDFNFKGFFNSKEFE